MPTRQPVGARPRPRSPDPCARAAPARLDARAGVLKLLRRTYNLSQDAAGRVVGVHGDTWSRWERGCPPIDHLRLDGVLVRFRAWVAQRKARRAARQNGGRP